MTFASWHLLFLDLEVKPLILETIKIFSTFKTYLSLRNHTLKVKGKFDKYFYFELCGLRVFINFMMDYFYLNIKEIEKLIYFEKYSLVGFFIVALVKNIPVKYQAMFYLCSLIDKSIFYYEKLDFDLVGWDFSKFGQFFLMFIYGKFKNRHLFWIRQLFFNGIFYLKKILKFYSLLILMNFLVFFIRFSGSEVLLFYKIDGFVICFILMFGYFFFKNDSYVYLWKSKHYYSHKEKELKKDKTKQKAWNDSNESVKCEKNKEKILQKKIK